VLSAWGDLMSVEELAVIGAPHLAATARRFE
jgi:hypothetical protein